MSKEMPVLLSLVLADRVHTFARLWSGNVVLPSPVPALALLGSGRWPSLALYLAPCFSSLFQLVKKTPLNNMYSSWQQTEKGLCGVLALHYGHHRQQSSAVQVILSLLEVIGT